MLCHRAERAEAQCPPHVYNFFCWRLSHAAPPYSLPDGRRVLTGLWPDPAAGFLARRPTPAAACARSRSGELECRAAGAERRLRRRLRGPIRLSVAHRGLRGPYVHIRKSAAISHHAGDGAGHGVYARSRRLGTGATSRAPWRRAGQTCFGRRQVGIGGNVLGGVVRTIRSQLPSRLQRPGQVGSELGRGRVGKAWNCGRWTVIPLPRLVRVSFSNITYSRDSLREDVHSSTVM